MNQNEVDNQIIHMCKFIEQEAEEKAHEILDAANEEFNLEKLQLLENEKTNIRKEYERKEAQAEVKKKIAYSKYVNDSRLKVLRSREEAVQEVINAARADLIKVSKHKENYSGILKKLIIQGLRKMEEKKVILKCRKVDLQLVKNIIDKSRELYASQYGDSAPEVKIDDEDFLNPPPETVEDDSYRTCCGGIKLMTMDRTIVLSNTLDDRLMIAFQENLPSIRKRLFD